MQYIKPLLRGTTTAIVVYAIVENGSPPLSPCHATTGADTAADWSLSPQALATICRKEMFTPVLKGLSREILQQNIDVTVMNFRSNQITTILAHLLLKMRPLIT